MPSDLSHSLSLCPSLLLSIILYSLLCSNSTLHYSLLLFYILLHYTLIIPFSITLLLFHSLLLSYYPLSLSIFLCFVSEGWSPNGSRSRTHLPSRYYTRKVTCWTGLQPAQRWMLFHNENEMPWINFRCVTGGAFFWLWLIFACTCTACIFFVLWFIMEEKGNVYIYICI